MKLLLNKKNLIYPVMALAILLIYICLLPIRAYADTPGTINDNNVNIRSQADATSTSLGKVNSGDKVTIIEEVNSASNVLWYKVTTATGTTGYIRADFVTKSTGGDNTNTASGNTTQTTTPAQPTTTTTTNVTDIASKAAYIAGDVVNIRSQASASSDLIAKANKNSEVTVTGETTASDGYKWYRVTFNADGATKNGFIRSDLLTFTKPTNTPAETNIDSTTTTPDTPEDTGNTETTEPADTPETVEPAKEETPAEQPAEKKKEITILNPSDEPEIIPDGFTEVQLSSGEKAWSKGDYFIIFGVNEEGSSGWYVLDEKSNNYISYDGLFTGTAKKSGKSDDKIFGILSTKFVLIFLTILVIVLLGVVFFMALKLSKGVENDDDYDYDDYEDEEEDEEEDIPVSSIENSRRSSGRRSEPKGEKPSKMAKAKDKFLNYFTTEVDDDEEEDEYYDDVDDDDDEIDFIDI